MQVVRTARCLGEAGIVAVREAWQERVRSLHLADAGEPKLLHQPILQRSVRPLDTALGLAGVGAQDLDVQPVEGTTELGHAVTGLRVLFGDTEHRVLVGIERHGAAMGGQIQLERLEVAERALGGHEPQHQALSDPDAGREIAPCRCRHRGRRLSHTATAR